jgi:flagellar export protein FliJ
MRRFHFKLGVLLDLKKRAEDEVKKDIARKNGEILVSRKERGELAGRLEAFFVEEKKQRLSVLDLLSLRLSIVYRGQIQKEIAQADKRIESLTAELGQLRVRLALARKECRVLEILREKKLARWKKEYKKEEQVFIDDVSQKGYIRRQRAASQTG